MLMISKGVDINSQDKAGETAIHQVAIRGLEETLAILVNIKGVNLNIPDVYVIRYISKYSNSN